MASVDIASGTIIEGSDVWFTTRLRKADGSDVQYDVDLSSWSIYVYDEGSLVYSLEGITPTSIGSGGQFSVSLLGPDGYSDSKYNFRHRLQGAAFDQQGGHTYRMIYVFITTQFGKIKAMADVRVVPADDE